MTSEDGLGAAYRRALADAGSAGGPHPDETLWERVLCGEASAAERDRFHEHVLACSGCVETYRALLALRREAAAFDPAVREVAAAPSAPTSQWSRGWMPYALAAAVLLAVVTPLAWRTWRVGSDVPPGGTAATASTPETPALSAHPVFAIEKAPVLLSASLVLTPRGAADDRAAFLDALGKALDPYRADDFREAASQLEEVARQYPQQVEPDLYAGVSFLMLGQPTDAVPHLERARTHASAEFVEEIDWRLGLAFVHAGDPGRARDPFKRVCDTGRVYRDRACRAGELLVSR